MEKEELLMWIGFNCQNLKKIVEVKPHRKGKSSIIKFTFTNTIFGKNVVNPIQLEDEVIARWIEKITGTTPNNPASLNEMVNEISNHNSGFTELNKEQRKELADYLSQEENIMKFLT
jgi:hypothetical protein